MATHDIIIEAIRQQLRTKMTDMGRFEPPRWKPADPEDIANDERQLGFALPPLLKRIYTEIGNGGFGPGYGFIGLTNGIPDDMGKTAPASYALFRGESPDEPNWHWPSGLLPICHWGCAIVSGVDCTDPNYRMQIFDPNVQEGSDWAGCFFDESRAFDAWISAWASGVDLWKQMYGDNGEISRLLSARRSIR